MFSLAVIWAIDDLCIRLFVLTRIFLKRIPIIIFISFNGIRFIIIRRDAGAEVVQLFDERLQGDRCAFIVTGHPNAQSDHVGRPPRAVSMSKASAEKTAFQAAATRATFEARREGGEAKAVFVYAAHSGNFWKFIRMHCFISRSCECGRCSHHLNNIRGATMRMRKRICLKIRYATCFCTVSRKHNSTQLPKHWPNTGHFSRHQCLTIPVEWSAFALS